jgi:hypothetical protein
MRFDWDPRKASANLEKHGVAFEEAITAFEDDDYLIAADHRHSTSLEERQWLIGRTDTGRIITVAFTTRDQGRVHRIISARPASRRERRFYEAYPRIPL